MVRALLQPFIVWSYNVPPAHWVRDSTWAFPILEVFHLLGLTLLLGSVFLFALRCFGLTLQKDPTIRVARDMAPASLAGIIIMAFSGYLMFASGAIKYANNLAFQCKMALFFTAIVVHGVGYMRVRVASVGHDGSRVQWVMAGGLILLLWFGVGIAGRAIAFL